MKPTPERQTYSREIGRVMMPWMTAGFCVNTVGLIVPNALQDVHAARPLGAGLLLLGAALICLSVWRGWSWRKAHPFRHVETPGEGAR